MQINGNYHQLQESYLFSTIAKKVTEFAGANPGADIIRLGIGDVTRPLCSSVISAMHKAVDEMANESTFRGYGPEQGYEFLRVKIQDYYKKRGVALDCNEIFVSDGAKSDVGNILDIFSSEITAMIPDPVYPVYVDTNTMSGNSVAFLDANQDNNFLPLPDDNTKADIIYLCSPNNPTGAVYNHEQLKAWVDYAIKNDAIILFDAAYEAFIGDNSLPRSIFEIDGAKRCAIEFCSLSKTAGFTGTRCGYTVVPMELERQGTKLNKLWLRRQTTKFNGVSYIVQRAAEAVFSEEGQREVRETIAYYKSNAKLIADALKARDVWYTGAEHSPYIWLKCPQGMGSWEFFDYLLENANIVGTPGSGFGKNGEGFFRLSAFGSRENVVQAVERLKRLSV